MTFTVSYQRSQYIGLPPHISLADELEYLLFGILDHLLARQIGIGFAGSGKQQPEKIVYLGSLCQPSNGDFY